MKFFNIDLHISIIADMRKIFTDLGHEVYDKSLSDHTWVFNRPKDSVPMLDNGRWKNLTPQQYSDEFYEQHKNEMSEYDAFIVTYPPPFSSLYDKFDKLKESNEQIVFFKKKAESAEKKLTDATNLVKSYDARIQKLH